MVVHVRMSCGRRSTNALFRRDLEALICVLSARWVSILFGFCCVLTLLLSLLALLT